MESEVLMTEALKAGPLVIIMWLLLNRLERRFGAFEDTFGKRVQAIELKLADGSQATRLEALERRAAEDRLKVDAEGKNCAAQFALLQREMAAVWKKIGDRPEDRQVG